ncbi:MAG TPA: XapX domain-containing protein [Spongiibacteraceae bacterium]|nr:XapX domain-containing protein [Spongiibacteraceae bacterium]
MKIYLLSFAVGLLVGIIYALLNVRSPAPPVVALVGLLGILIGEQTIPLAKRVLSGQPISIGWFQKECVPHIFGELPAGESANAAEPKRPV